MPETKLQDGLKDNEAIKRGEELKTVFGVAATMIIAAFVLHITWMILAFSHWWWIGEGKLNGLMIMTWILIIAAQAIILVLTALLI